MNDRVNPALRVRQTSLGDLKNITASGHLYVVVDACSVPLAPAKVVERGSQQAVSLYSGSAEEEFWEVAPYLMRVDELVLSWILETSSKVEGWGIFIASRADMETLRRHLRHFLKVQAPDGDIWMFRFYDPRVMRPFLTTSDAGELRSFLGPILAYGLTAEDGQSVEFFQPPQNVLPDDPLKYQFLFRLRTEHLVGFQPLIERDFVTRLCEHIRKYHAAATEGMSDDVLRQRVMNGVARAKGYGLQLEATLAGFVALMFEFAPNFDKHASFHEILRDPEVPPEKRVDELVDLSSEEDWEAVEKNSDPAAWAAQES